MTEPGPLLAQFEERASEQRALAWVRGSAGLLALGGATAMLLGELPLPLFLVALLALLLSVAWLGQARRALRASKQPRRARLRVYAAGLQRDEAEQSHWLSWADVEAVEVDEERLDVVIRLRRGPPVRLEPRYPGVDIYELVRTLDQARQSAPKTVGRDQLG